MGYELDFEQEDTTWRNESDCDFNDLSLKYDVAMSLRSHFDYHVAWKCFVYLEDGKHVDNLEIEPYRLVLWWTIEENVPIVMLIDGLRVKSVFVRNIGSFDAYMKLKMLLKVPKLVYQELRIGPTKTTLVQPN